MGGNFQWNTQFVRYNKNKYGLPLAIWVACEVWDFGTLSRLYAGMREEDQDAISKKYGIHNGRIFATWLRSLNYLRNVCAHHSRLWNRNIVDQPRLPAANEVPWVEPFEDDAHLRALFSAAAHRQPLAPGGKPQFKLGGVDEEALAGGLS